MLDHASFGPSEHPGTAQRRFLFLQGPITPFFAEIAAGLRALGHATHRIALCHGDNMFWRGAPAAIAFRGRFAAWPGFVAGILDEHAITDLVLLGEQRPYHRVAIAAAKARGVAVAVTDFGYLRPDWIVLERDGMGAESRFPRDPEAILALVRRCPPFDHTRRHWDSFPRQARWDVAFHLASLLPFGFPHYESWLLHHPIPAYLGTGLRLLRRGHDTRRAAALLERLKAHQGPLFCFAMQMENDYSIRAYSDFRDNDGAIAQAVGSFARGAPKGAQLIVKIHPLDPGLKAWGRRIRRMAEAEGVAERVHFMGGALPMDPVILACRGIVTINSTVGIRSVALGRATKPLGRAIYDVPGLSWQGGLDAFWREAPPPDPELAEAFLRAIAACLHVRGVYYARPGLDAAVAATVQRLHRGVLNAPLEQGEEAVVPWAEPALAAAAE